MNKGMHGFPKNRIDSTEYTYSGTAVFSFLLESDTSNDGDVTGINLATEGITLNNIISAFFFPFETTESSLDDHKLNGVSARLTNTTKTTLVPEAISINGATGYYSFKYIIKYLK